MIKYWDSPDSSSPARPPAARAAWTSRPATPGTWCWPESRSRSLNWEVEPKSRLHVNWSLINSVMVARLTLLAILSLSARLVASLLTLVGTTPRDWRLGAPRGLRLSSISWKQNINIKTKDKYYSGNGRENKCYSAFSSKLSSTARISLTVFKEQFRKKTLPELE